MKKRYEIDHRTGCIAVIDTTIPWNSPGLYSYSDHVVFYKGGYQRPEKDGKPNGWGVREEDVKRAESLCDSLNGVSEIEKRLNECLSGNWGEQITKLAYFIKSGDMDVIREIKSPMCHHTGRGVI